MMESTVSSEALLDRLRGELLRLAKAEEQTALAESAKVHYWEPSPVSAVAHRFAADLLRKNAEQLDGSAA
ncbi:hypothetical protein [Nocardioides jensenii]|uniref:hypothetical protein n=1 Tax=Nocardioides jensenii TaxID=1843 RepID=UPI000A4C3A2B|nr:hypothetical protein [Nocardioides jensenii]